METAVGKKTKSWPFLLSFDRHTLYTVEEVEAALGCKAETLKQALGLPSRVRGLVFGCDVVAALERLQEPAKSAGAEKPAPARRRRANTKPTAHLINFNEVLDRKGGNR